MPSSTLTAEANPTENSNPSENSNPPSSLLSSGLSDFEKQFDNGLDLDKADKKFLNKYVFYRLSQYTLLNSVNYELWISIQADFANFIEQHLNQLNESIWKSLLDYCYSHDYWIDHDSLRKCSANFLKTLNANSEYNNNNWTADQIRWVEYNYKKLSSNIRQRKHEIMKITNVTINQGKIISDEKGTIIKVELKTYIHSQATQFQMLGFDFFSLHQISKFANFIILKSQKIKHRLKYLNTSSINHQWITNIHRSNLLHHHLHHRSHHHRLNQFLDSTINQKTIFSDN